MEEATQSKKILELKTAQNECDLAVQKMTAYCQSSIYYILLPKWLQTLLAGRRRSMIVHATASQQD